MERQIEKDLNRAFSRIHDAFREIRSYATLLDDPTLHQYLDEMEVGVLKPLRRMRKYLSVDGEMLCPYFHKNDDDLGTGSQGKKPEVATND